MSAASKKQKTITIELGEELRDRLNWVAQFKDQSAAQIIRKLVEEHTSPFMERIEAHRKLLRESRESDQLKQQGLNSREDGDDQTERA
jgi:predicted DNA-binding protein